MCARVRNLGVLKNGKCLPGEQDITYLRCRSGLEPNTGKMSAFYQNRLCAQFVDLLSRFLHVLKIVNIKSGQGDSLIDIGGYDRRQGNQRHLQGIDRALLEKPVSARGDHNRDDDDICQLMVPYLAGHQIDDLCAGAAFPPSPRLYLCHQQ